MIVKLEQVHLPKVERPRSEPKIRSEEYLNRISKLRSVMSKRGLDCCIVYGDREHYANMTFLMGYDPRFEEALLILHKDGSPILMVGNEGWSYTDVVVPIEIEKVLVQCFSLMGQPRDKMKELSEFLEDAKVKPGMKVGIAGWKYFTSEDFGAYGDALEIPEYIARAVRRQVGNYGAVVNANDLLMSPEYGLRAVNDVDQIAVFEFAATICSQAIHGIIEHLEVGMTEYEAVESLRYNGMPLTCHLMLSTGKRAFYGLSSPSDKVIDRAEPLTTAMGLRGTLTCRAGYIAEDEKEVNRVQPSYLSEICIPYFMIVSRWYEMVGIGVKGSEIHDIAENLTQNTVFKFTLNPGHLTHLEEWLNTPFYKGSNCVLRSGMALQVDLIPVPPSGKFGINIEDTVVLADEELRQKLQSKYPDAFKRIEQRRMFMNEVLGINLREEVLPLCDNPAVLRPLLLSTDRVLVLKEN